MTCPPCTHDCREGRDCPLITINAQVVGYVEPQRQWVGLTEEEVELYWDWEDFQCGCGPSTLFAMVRDIESRLKERNI
jgi:hypothetical protein